MTGWWSHLGVIRCHLVIAAMLTCVASQGDKYLLSTNGGSQIWGHKYTVKRNETGLATTATRPRSWVDYDVSLPVGRLIRFYAYINRIDPSMVSNVQQLRFQIWYAVNRTQYRLLYEKKTNVTNTEGVIQVEADAGIYLPSFCRLGWTSDNSIIPISFDFVDQYPLFYRTINNVNTDFPVVGELYTNFNLYPYPAVFSVAVEIDPRLEGATGATGPPGSGSGGNGTGSGGGGFGSTGATGPPGPPGPAGPPGYSSGNDVINVIDYSRCWNVTSSQPSVPGCSQVQCNSSDPTANPCHCFSGFSIGADQKTCNDADECAYHNGGCAMNCTNTVGSYYCSCPPGLYLGPNQQDCLDIDECKTIKCDQVCVNNYGSYVCLKVTNVYVPVQGLRQDGTDNQDNTNNNNNNNNASINSTATTTGILIWIAILTLCLLILTVAFIYKWRRNARGERWNDNPGGETPSAGGSLDGRSDDGGGDPGRSFADFGNWKFSLSDRTSKRAAHPSVASILSLQGDFNPPGGAEQNSKL